LRIAGTGREREVFEQWLAEGMPTGPYDMDGGEGARAIVRFGGPPYELVEGPNHRESRVEPDRVDRVGRPRREIDERVRLDIMMATETFQA
jgi:hypothetical protein